ncbi:MAG: hypothetical protein DRI98_10685 [Bacteroidetes bacterium]|nr:MAG: hypothetical protein DRI98_10685 [Bacteroidota bacterium]
MFVAIELKVDAPLDKLQKYKLEKIAISGGIAIIMTPVNFDETLVFLTQIANEAEGIYREHAIIQ